MIATSHSPISDFTAERHALPIRGTLWTQLPWVAALLIAPFWFGGVSETGQIFLGLLVSLSLFCTLPQVRCIPESLPGKCALGGLLLVLLVSLLPLPRALGSSPELLEIASGNAGTLSFAPGATITRAWQLSVAAACFLLAREAVQVHGFVTLLARGLAIATLGLGVLELWRLVDGQGIWTEARHYPAGTFANRNHFASWMSAAGMFLFGALLRTLKTNRERAEQGLHDIALFSAALLMALGAVIACGSRGGLMALLIGISAWAAILWGQKVHGVALGVFGLLILSSVVLFGVAGGAVMGRAADASLTFKYQIWRDAFQVFTEFPWIGIGLGAFPDVFSVRKTFHGEGSILFAENEYLQWLLEAGLAGTLFALILAFCATVILKNGLLADRISRKGLFHGAMAALIGMIVHAAFEFTFQVMAVALLAGTLFGYAMGLAQRSTRKVEPLPGRGDMIGTTILAVFIALASIQQLRATQKFTSAPDQTGRNEAVWNWPLDKERSLLAARQAMAQGAHQDARTILDAALRARPYDWELRAERAWWELAAGANRSAAQTEARKAIATNPLQPKLPLRFAASLAAAYPVEAMELLRLAPVQKYDDVREALRIAWSIEQNGAMLWEFARTAEGLRALAQFAREQNLPGLANEAEEKLKEVIGAGNSH